MKAVGLIVEYNPFHNGHLYHLKSAKEAANADVAIAVMSGNFLQRGEPALVPKWCRTQMALENGADIVLELPYSFAVQQAEIFAYGAVSMLDAIGAEYVCFGSESGNIDLFLTTIEFLDQHQGKFNEQIKAAIRTGVSYPKALALAFQQLDESGNFLDLARPNNILGIEYIRAIQKQNSSIRPLTITRKNANYHDEHFASETIASATSIRKALFSPNADTPPISQFVPKPTLNLLQEYHRQFGFYHFWENYWGLLQFRLLQISRAELRNIYEIEEGLENRLIAAAAGAQSFHEFMEAIKTKRYTWTRLQRACVHILTNAQKHEMSSRQETASYLRLLGMTDAGRDYLNKRKNQFSLPLVSKVSAFQHPKLALDIKAAQIYALAYPPEVRSKMMRQEYSQPPLYIK
jgi:predicted nucleotidyltransferase